MPLKAIGMTDTGKTREHNEDSFYVNLDLGLALVADGIGGQAAGEMASAIAAESVADFIRRTGVDQDTTWPDDYDRNLNHAHNRLRSALASANRRIRHRMNEMPDTQGMGTTAVAALLEDGILQIASVGDSRAYLLRQGTLTQITHDHSWIQEQLDEGVITEEMAHNHPLRNVITRALGSAEASSPDHYNIDLEDGDLVMLCTDGLSGMLSDDEIKTIISLGEEDLEQTAEALINRANENGGLDNITVVLMLYRQDTEDTKEALSE